jgi:exosortase/archaeosortase family protein
MQPHRWRQGLPAALLLIGALPFGEHMDTFVGYPVRLVTARIVRDGLAVLGKQSINVDTILIFESGVSQVDLPCSGVKSLWTGGMFLMAITWIERRRVGLRWLLVAVCFAVLLLVANLARVAILVAVGQVLGWRLFAEMLHVPLGVIGFVAACAAAVGMLRWLPSDTTANLADIDNNLEPTKFDDGARVSQLQFSKNPEEKPLAGISGAYNPAQQPYPESKPPTLNQAEVNGLPRPTWLPAALAGILVLMVLLYTPRSGPASAHTPPAWNFDPQLASEPWPFSPGEQKWLSQGEPLDAGRWRFQWGDFSGSVLIISSQTWRAHHRPERCFEVYGLSSNHTQTFLAAADFPLRQLTLGNDSQRDLYAATYWFQSADRITDDYGTRMWADLSADQQPWTLVTVLFDQAYDPQDPQLVELYKTLRQSVHNSLEGGVQP